jgi:hypothetical protein
MAVDERTRRELYERAEHALGREGADTLMSLLPPVGWADVATKHDLDQVAAILDQKIAALDQNVDQKIEASKQDIVNTLTWRMFTMLIAVVAAVAAFVVPLSA